MTALLFDSGISFGSQTFSEFGFDMNDSRNKTRGRADWALVCGREPRGYAAGPIPRIIHAGFLRFSPIFAGIVVIGSTLAKLLQSPTDLLLKTPIRGAIIYSIHA